MGGLEADAGVEPHMDPATEMVELHKAVVLEVEGCCSRLVEAVVHRPEVALLVEGAKKNNGQQLLVLAMIQSGL